MTEEVSTVEVARASAATETISASDTGKRLDAMVRENSRCIWRILRRHGVPPECADDATQQVLVVAATRISSIRLGSERSFLIGTALRVASEYRRSRRRSREVPDGTEEAQETLEYGVHPDDLLDRRRAADLLDTVLDSMPDDVRVAFVLFEFEGMSTPEIATLVGVPLGTASSRLRRGREIFQAAVKSLRAGKKKYLRGQS